MGSEDQQSLPCVDVGYRSLRGRGGRGKEGKGREGLRGGKRLKGERGRIRG